MIGLSICRIVIGYLLNNRRFDWLLLTPCSSLTPTLAQFRTISQHLPYFRVKCQKFWNEAVHLNGSFIFFGLTIALVQQILQCSKLEQNFVCRDQWTVETPTETGFSQIIYWTQDSWSYSHGKMPAIQQVQNVTIQKGKGFRMIFTKWNKIWVNI